MGKGDKKTAKGKRALGSYGVRRPRKKLVAAAMETIPKEPKPKKKAEPKAEKPAKAAAEKPKKTAASKKTKAPKDATE